MTMVSVSKYSTTQVQTASGVPYKNWGSLYRLEANDNSDARCDDIGSASGSYNRPGPLKVTGFGFNIPSTARIDSIVVTYEHFKISHSSASAHMSIAAPTLSLYNVGAGSQLGNAPPTSRTAYSKTWTRSSTWQPTPAMVNSGNFGVGINYPKNTSGNPGDLALDYILVTVNYTLPTYSVAMSTPASKVLSEPVTFDITVNNTNNINANGNATVNLKIPSGLVYATHSGPGTYSNGVWNAKLTNSTAKLSITFNTVAVGSQTLTATEASTGVNISRTVAVDNPTYDLSSTLPSSVVQAATFTYTVKIEVNSSAITNADVNIPFNNGLSYISSSGDGTYDPGTGVWNAVFSNQEAILTINAVAETVGEISQTITQGTSATITNMVNVISSTLTTTYNVVVPFSEEILSELEDGREYIVAFYAVIVDSQNHAYFSGPLNNRFSIIQGTDETLSTQISNIGVTELLTARFTYHEGISHSFKFYAGYVGYFETDIGVEFSQEPTIVPIEYFEGFEDPTELFNDKNLLLSNNDFAELNLESLQKSGSYVFEDINTAGLETDETILVTGFKITGDCILSGDTIITAGIYSLKDELLQESSPQSCVLDSDTTQISIGGTYDNWGLNLNQINIADLRFYLQLQNMTTDSLNVLLNNLELTIFYTIDQTGGVPGFTIEGTHSKLFSIMLDEDGIPRGANNDVNYSDVTGADGKYPTRSNIKEKTIKLKFNVISEALTESDSLMDRIIQWISNERDKYNKPISKGIIFDLEPYKQYNYILEKPITADRNFEDFECEAELIIPDGVAESVDTKITGMVGTNNGLTRVFPVIKLLTTGSEIVITESIENQTMTIHYEFTRGTALIYDAKTKKIIDTDGNDYTEYIDMNSDRLVLNNQYNFSNTTGATIQSISFKERF
jgi:Phage tail protein.